MNTNPPNDIQKADGNTPENRGVVVFRPNDVITMRTWTSLDPASERGVRLIPEIRFGESIPIVDMSDKEIDICDIFWHPASRVDEQTGETITFRRVVLIAPDDKLYTGYGIGINQSIEMYLSILPMPPWNPPKRFFVKKIKCQTGYMPVLILKVGKEVQAKRENKK